MNTQKRIEAGLRMMSGHTPTPRINAELLQERLRRREKQINFTRAISAVAAVAVLITGTVLLLSVIGRNAVKTTLTLDSSAGIAISLNSRDEVIAVTATDQRGVRALSGYDPSDRDLSLVTVSLISYLIDHDTLNRYDNTVLVSSEDSDLSDTVAGYVGEAYAERDFAGAVLSQGTVAEPEVERLSAKYHITSGKAQLTRELIESDRTMSYGALARMSVNDLNLIADSIGLTYEYITVSGVSSRLQYLPAQQVENIVVEDLGHGSVAVRTRFDARNGELLYRLTVQDGDFTYTYSLVAATGEIITVIRAGQNSVEVIVNQTSSTARSEIVENGGEGYTPVIQPTEAIVPVPEPTKATGDNPPAAVEPTGAPTSAATEPVTESKAGETPAAPKGIDLTSDQYYSVPADLKSAGYILRKPADSWRKLDSNLVFSGLYTVPREGSDQQFVSGEAAVIGNARQLARFLSVYDYPYTALRDGKETAFDPSALDDDYFRTKALVVAVYELDNMPYEFSINDIYTDGERLYADAAYTTPDNIRTWYTTSRHICIYEIDSAELRADMQLELY